MNEQNLMQPSLNNDQTEQSDSLLGVPAEEQPKFQSIFGYRSKLTMAEMEAQNKARYERATGPATIEDLDRARTLAENLEPAAALAEVKGVITRLPENQRANFPPVLADKNSDLVEQWDFLKQYPKTTDILTIPAFQRLLGTKAKKIGLLEKVLYSNPVGATWLGGKRGGRNYLYGRHAQMNLWNFSDPQFQAEMFSMMAQRAEDADFLEALNFDAGPVARLFREFLVNFGDTGGGMLLASMSPEALLGAAGGGVAGAIAGPGSVFTATGGWLKGSSLALAGSAGGANAWEAYLAQPDEMKDEELARRAFFFTAVPSFILERLGAGYMIRGAGPGVRRAIGSAAHSAAPKTAAQITALLAEKSYRGIATRLAVNSVAHTVPEIITEGLQEGPVEVGSRMMSATLYNRAYGGRGYYSSVPKWDEMIESALAGAWQAVWGGSGIGLIGPGAQALAEKRQISTTKLTTGSENATPLTDNQQEEIINYGEEAAVRKLHIDTISRANAELRSQIKSATDIIRNDQELSAEPEVMRGVLERFGEQRAYVNAETLNSLFQSTLENRSPEWENIESGFLAPLGVSVEQLSEAIDNGTDILLDLNGLPEVINNPLWEQVANSLTVEPLQLTEQMRMDLENMGPPTAIVERADADVSQKVRMELENNLIAAGRNKNFARREAAVWSRMAGNLARITGVKADSLINNVTFMRGMLDNSGSRDSLQQAAHIPATDSRVEFRTGMEDLAPVRVIDGGLIDNNITYDQAKLIASAYSQQVVENADLGESIRITNTGIRETLRHRPSQADLKAFEVLLEMLSSGQWVRKDPDIRSGRQSSGILFLYAPVKIDNDLFAAQITVKRRENGELNYYGHSLKKTEGIPAKWSGETESASSPAMESLQNDGNPATWSSEAVLDTTSSSSAMDSQYNFKIIDLLEKVKRRGTRLPDDLSSLYQSESDQGSRGRLDFLADGSLRIVFTEAADASTAIHEFQHTFIKMAQDILSLPLDQIADMEAHNQLKADMETLENWAGIKDGEWTVEAHEKVARAFEQYFMEGKAPVKALKNIFSQMKNWLLKIYESLRNLGEPLSDDVRRVFDRQLATEAELAVESWRNEPTFDTADMYDMDPRAMAEYEAAVTKGREAAKEEIISFRNSEHERMRHQWKREGLEAAKADPRQKRLVEIVQRGGINPQSLAAAGIVAGEINRRRPGIVKKDSKLGIDEMAEEYGFESADDFYQSIISTPSIKELTDAYIFEQEALFERYFDSDSIITDAELDAWEMERNLWARFMGDPGSKYQNRSWRDIKKFIDRKTGIKPIDEIAAQNMADLKASLKAQVRAARSGERAGYGKGLDDGKAKGYKRGGVEGYYAGRNEARAEALEKRLELAVQIKSAAERQREMDKTVAQWQRIIKQKTADIKRPGGILPEYHGQIKNMLSMFGLGKPVSTETDLKSFVNNLEADGLSVAVPDWVLDGNLPVWETGRRAGQRKTWRSLDYNQFTELKNAVTSLLFFGRRQQQVRVNGRLMSEDTAAGDLIKSIAAHNDLASSKNHQELLNEAAAGKSFGRGILDALSGYMSGIIKVETMARRLDGGEYGGTAQKLIYDQINRAYDRATLLTEDIIDNKLKPIIESTIGLKRLRKMRSEKVTIEVAGDSSQNFVLSREQLLVAGLSVGNEQNMRALRNYKLGPDGTPMTDMQYQALLDTLTQEEWSLIQSLWDFMDNEMFPLLNDLTLRTKGVPLAKVQAAPVLTRFGLMRGGYFPLVFDSSMSSRAAQIKETADITTNSPTLFASSPNTRASATVERSGRTYKDLVPKLSFDVLTRSLTENIHDLTHREAVSDVWRIIKREDVREAIGSALGGNYWLQMKRWLQEIARPEQVGDSGMARILRKFRGNTSAAAMGLKVSVMICQGTGISQSAQKLGAAWTAVGIKEFYGMPDHIRQVKAMIDSKSVQMKNRIKGSYDRDIKDALTTHSPLQESLGEKMTEHMFKGIAVLDLAATYPVWLGAYLKATKEGKNEADAVSYADAIVRTTQPTGASKDLSYAQRGWGFGEAGKLITMFSTFFNATQNIIWEQFHQTKGDFKKGNYLKGTYQAGRTALLLALIPAFLEAVIKEGWPDDEEDWNDIAKNATSYTVGGMPVVKDAISYFLGNSYRFQPAPILGSMESMLKAPGGVVDIAEGETIKGVSRILRGVGPVTGLPTSQITTTLKGAEDWDDNEGFEAFYRLLVRESPK
ncbi:hypothetical protein C4J81_17115 [Deltaproteobacteria bacterium Smac51]|nr:hypothetical protein C4J81_17115 [Deltaproteobacteria bacterium Smac51]